MFHQLASICSVAVLSAVCAVIALAGGPAADRPSASGPGASAHSWLQSRCGDCHAGGAGEGGFDLDSLGDDLSDRATLAGWIRIHDRVQRGEMPPPDAELLGDAQRDRFIAPLADSLRAAHAAQKSTVLRRLNRREYENTLNDLFGTRLDLASRLPEDGRWGEFDNVGEALSISMLQLQQYIETIQFVLDESIQSRSTPPESRIVRASYADMRGADKFIGKQWYQTDDGAVVFYNRLGYPSGMLREANVPQRGRYKIRVTGYAHQSDRPITFAVGATSFARAADRPTFGYFEMPPGEPHGEPTTIELEALIDARYMIEVTPFGIYDTNYEIKNRGIENYRGPGLAILHVEVEGPLAEAFPSRGHTLVMDALKRVEIEPRNPRDKERASYVPKFEIHSETPIADATVALTRVAQAAFRRPVDADDVAPYVELFRSELDQDEPFEEALRTAIAAIFCSPDFLFLRESEGTLDDHALAARLAYFLSRTTPDAELLAAASKNKLTGAKLAGDESELGRQAKRLLDDPRLDRFVVDFTDAWLDLREIEFTVPDRKLYPEYDLFLEHSMVDETRAFFRELLAANLSVGNIVRSDFAMLNNRLAQHYELPPVDGPEIRRVDLPPHSVRGGFLSQGSVLKVSANGTNTSPVVRGVWVNDRILGEHTQPPPPGIPGVEPDIRGSTTLRELLDKHRNLDQCRVCHSQIDPPGFALENFDPVGLWRDRFRGLDGESVSSLVEGRKVTYRLGPPVDASGELLDGRTFDGFVEFRDHLAADEDALARAFATKLLTFATGRELGFSDREAIEAIVEQSAKHGHGTRDLLLSIIDSEIFRSK